MLGIFPRRDQFVAWFWICMLGRGLIYAMQAIGLALVARHPGMRAEVILALNPNTFFVIAYASQVALPLVFTLVVLRQYMSDPINYKLGEAVAGLMTDESHSRAYRFHCWLQRLGTSARARFKGPAQGLRARLRLRPRWWVRRRSLRQSRAGAASRLSRRDKGVLHLAFLYAAVPLPFVPLMSVQNIAGAARVPFLKLTAVILIGTTVQTSVYVLLLPKLSGHF